MTTGVPAWSPDLRTNLSEFPLGLELGEADGADEGAKDRLSGSVVPVSGRPVPVTVFVVVVVAVEVEV